MRSARRQKLELVLGAGGSLVGTIALLGLAWPRYGELRQLREKWAEIESLARKGAELQEGDRESDRDRPAFERDVKLLLPEKDRSVEFLAMVHLAAKTAGVGEIPFYKLERAALWPASVPENKEDRSLPDDYRESPQAADPDKVQRHVVALDFVCDYAALLRFCERVHKLPRHAQIVSAEVELRGRLVKATLRVEAYSWKGAP